MKIPLSFREICNSKCVYKVYLEYSVSIKNYLSSEDINIKKIEEEKKTSKFANDAERFFFLIVLKLLWNFF